MKLKLTLIIIVTVLLTNIVLVYSTPDENTILPELKFGKDTFYPGESIVMSLRLKGEVTGVKTNSVTFEVEYDDSAFELESNDANQDIRDGYIDFTTKHDRDMELRKSLKLMYVNMNREIDIIDGAIVFTAKMKVKESAVEGVRIFNIKPIKMIDKEYNAYHVNNGEVYSKTVEVLPMSEREKIINKFTDVQSDHWAKSFIDVLTDRKVIYGMTETTFEPKSDLTRAQFAAFIVRALELEEKDYTGEFSDVKKGDWYDRVVATAVDTGIIAGMGNGTFAPNELITREQMCAMIVRAYEYITGFDSITHVEKYNGSFEDINDVSSWAVESVKSAYVLEIIRGMDEKTFAPGNNALREQAATIIVKLLEAGNMI